MGTVLFAALAAGGCGSNDPGAGDSADDQAAGGAGAETVAGAGGHADENASAGGSTSGVSGAAGASGVGAGRGGSSGSAGGGGRGGASGSGGAGGASASGDGGVVSNPDAGPVKPLPCTGVGTAGVWEDITPPQVPIGANGSGVPNVVTNPLSPGELYVCTYQKGIYKSSDCGASWTKVNTGRKGAALDSGTAWLFLIDPVTPNVLYADSFQGSDNNLFKSTNGGVDWDPLWLPGSPAAKAAGYPELLAIDPTNHLHLVANFHQNCNAPYVPVCFGETTDGGTTWRIVNGPSELKGWQEDASPIVVDAKTFLLGAIFTPLYLTTDDGATWSQVSSSGGLRMVHAGGWHYDGAAFGLQRSQDLKNWTMIPKTPGLVGFGFVTDGDTLFASSRYHINYVKSPVADGVNWTSFAAPSKLVNPDADGSYSLAIDTSHHILYSANQSSGVWRMNVAAK
jgi:hypothetical protein